MDFLREMLRGLEAAKQAAAEKGVDVNDTLFTVAGPDSPKVQTFDEINREGEPMVFLCCRVSEANYVLPGSTKKICDGCRQEVWMSPATEMSMDRLNKVVIVCVNCAGKMVK